MDFNERICRHSRNVSFTFWMPEDTKDRLEKLRPQEITFSEMIRQILDNYVGLDRPIRAFHVDPHESEIKYIRKTSKKKLPKT